MGGGRTNVEAPKESPEQRAYYAQLAEDVRVAREKKDAEEQAETARKSLLKSSGVKNLDPYYSILKQQLAAGAITSKDAQSQIEAYQQKYGMDPDNVASYVAEVQKFGLEQEPVKRETLVQRTFQDLLGRKASDQELKTRLDEITKSGGTLDIDAIATSLKSSDEYKEKVGGSYLENYYRTYFGPSEKKLVKGQDGAPDWYKSTGRYTISTGKDFSPVLNQDLEKTVGLKFGEAPSSFTGSAAEIENMQQKLRQRDEFSYNAGLTKLQGEIDSNIAKIKNKGTREVAEISSKTNIYGALASGFWS